MRVLAHFLAGILLGIAVNLAVRALARAEALPDRPVVIEKLPGKAVVPAKHDCRVVIGRGLIFLRTADGRIVPLAIISSLRTRC